MLYPKNIPFSFKLVLFGDIDLRNLVLSRNICTIFIFFSLLLTLFAPGNFVKNAEAQTWQLVKSWRNISPKFIGEGSPFLIYQIRDGSSYAVGIYNMYTEEEYSFPIPGGENCNNFTSVYNKELAQYQIAGQCHDLDNYVRIEKLVRYFPLLGVTLFEENPAPESFHLTAKVINPKNGAMITTKSSINSGWIWRAQERKLNGYVTEIPELPDCPSGQNCIFIPLQPYLESGEIIVNAQTVPGDDTTYMPYYGKANQWKSHALPVPPNALQVKVKDVEGGKKIGLAFMNGDPVRKGTPIIWDENNNFKLAPLPAGFEIDNWSHMHINKDSDAVMNVVPVDAPSKSISFFYDGTTEQYLNLTDPQHISSLSDKTFPTSFLGSDIVINDYSSPFGSDYKLYKR